MFSYRQYTVTGTASPFSFSPATATIRSKAAVAAWTGATLVDFNPDPGNDGVGTVAYKVMNPSPGVWHYEYAIYNQNLDRAIQSFRHSDVSRRDCEQCRFSRSAAAAGLDFRRNGRKYRIQQHALDTDGGDRRDDLEFGNFRAESERQRDSLGNALQYPF